MYQNRYPHSGPDIIVKEIKTLIMYTEFGNFEKYIPIESQLVRHHEGNFKF